MVDPQIEREGYGLHMRRAGMRFVIGMVVGIVIGFVVFRLMF
ncbi:MAG: hypothetical protein ABIC95_03605 [archaeon]